MIVAAVYIPLWTFAAAFCVLCLMPDAVSFGLGVVRSLRRRRKRRRLLDELWRDEIGAGSRAAVFSVRKPVATTPAAGTDDLLGGAA